MFRVYVDEAGTRQIHARTSRYFVVSAVMVHESHNDKVREQLEKLKVDLGRHPSQVLHFRNLRPLQKRIGAARGINGFTVARFISVIIDKKHIGEAGPAGDLAFIAEPDPMYLWSLRLLMERVSWYARDKQNQKAHMTFSHIRGFDSEKLHSYREALVRRRGERDMKIEWDVFDGLDFKISSPKRVDLLQAADVAASSTWHAVEPTANGCDCLDEMGPKLYRRHPGRITTYGLKTFPHRIGEPGGHLYWLAERY